MEKEEMIKRLIDANFIQVQAEVLSNILQNFRLMQSHRPNHQEILRLQTENEVINMKIDLFKWIICRGLLAVGIVIAIMIIA